MSFISFSSLALYTLGKFGFKIAERRQWLPGIFYHKISIRKLQGGYLREANQYNAIAMRKNPSREDVHLVHDIVSMRYDVQIATLKKRIGGELQKIRDIRRRQHLCRKEIQKLARTNRKHYLLPGLLVLTLINLSITIFLVNRLTFVWALGGSAGLLFILLLAVYDRFAAENSRILNRIRDRELQAAISAMQHEISVRKKFLSQYQNQLTSILIETNIG